MLLFPWECNQFPELPPLYPDLDNGMGFIGIPLYIDVSWNVGFYLKHKPPFHLIILLLNSTMAPTTNPLVMEIKNVLRRGVNDLIDDTEGFCTLVNDLQGEKAELTPSELRFLEYLVPFRDKLVRDAPVIASVECAEAQSQTELSAILDKSWDLKEAMRMYEGTLSASFDMEEEYDRFADRLQTEMDEVKEKKKQLQEDIRQDVANLLEKRRAFLELKESQKMLGRAHDRTSAELEVAMDCKDALEERWRKVKEMGNLA
jgi:hypothetical protein